MKVEPELDYLDGGDASTANSVSLENGFDLGKFAFYILFFFLYFVLSKLFDILVYLFIYFFFSFFYF